MGLLSKDKVTTDTLNKDELEHLLWALSESTFRGKDVHLLAGIVSKLQNQKNAK
tara:strand:- start:2143 stop:2304 length:162 start_codon:yes stop_codon:yes gene_type:complete